MGLVDKNYPIFFYRNLPKSATGRAFDEVVTPSVGLPHKFLWFDATVYVSPQSAASIRAPCPVATTATRSDLAAGLFDFAETASLPKVAQSSFLGQAEEVFKRINPG
jgi:hypothetical protein